MTGTEIEDVLARVNRGDATVAEQLHTAYAAYLRAVVRRRLSSRLRSKCDTVDVVQSVWAQVVRRVAAGWRVKTEPELRAMLAVIARRRIATRARRRTTGAGRVGGSALATVPQRHQPTPSQAVHATDLWERMLRLCEPQHRAVLLLRRDGLPLAEIAARTGLHEGSVRRILRRLCRELAEGTEPLDAGNEA